MALDLLGAGTIANTALNTGKFIAGLVQYGQGTKKLNNLLANRPKYNISQGYQDAYKTYQALANSQMPGYDAMTGQIGESTAKTNTYLERGAMGSNQYMSGVLQGQDKELDAIRNLGIMSAQWRSQQKQNLAGAQNQMGQLQDVQFQTNQLDPWNIKANMANEQRQAGNANLWSGLEGIGSNISQYAGARAYLQALKATNPNSNG
jgi:hypothetical protein